MQSGETLLKFGRRRKATAQTMHLEDALFLSVGVSAGRCMLLLIDARRCAPDAGRLTRK